jgi:hypothetical protein
MPQPKKAEHHDPTLVLLQSIMTGQATTTSSQQKKGRMMPHEQVEYKIATYKKMEEDRWPTFEKTLEWWSCRNTREYLWDKSADVAHSINGTVNAELPFQFVMRYPVTRLKEVHCDTNGRSLKD